METDKSLGNGDDKAIRSEAKFYDTVKENKNIVPNFRTGNLDGLRAHVNLLT